jgi:hypothetical protein
MRPAARLRSQGPPLLTARALSDALLAEDAMVQRVPPDARSALVDAALSEGRAYAESVSLDWGTDPWRIAQRLGLPVVVSDADASFGSVVVFAEYTAKPTAITLYRTAIERASLRFAASSARGVLNLEDCMAVFLAHELYHHLARSAATPPFSRAYRVTLLRLARWRWTSRVTSLEEIAASAFAQALLGLRFHPRLIELICVQQDGEAE